MLKWIIVCRYGTYTVWKHLINILNQDEKYWGEYTFSLNYSGYEFFSPMYDEYTWLIHYVMRNI